MKYAKLCTTPFHSALPRIPGPGAELLTLDRHNKFFTRSLSPILGFCIREHRVNTSIRAPMGIGTTTRTRLIFNANSTARFLKIAARAKKTQLMQVSLGRAWPSGDVTYEGGSIRGTVYAAVAWMRLCQPASRPPPLSMAYLISADSSPGGGALRRASAG